MWWNEHSLCSFPLCFDVSIATDAVAEHWTWEILSEKHYSVSVREKRRLPITSISSTALIRLEVFLIVTPWSLTPERQGLAE